MNHGTPPVPALTLTQTSSSDAKTSSTGGTSPYRARVDQPAAASALSRPPRYSAAFTRPFARGRHPGLNGAFVILTFEPGVDPDIAYLETPGGDIYLESADDVARRRVTFDELSQLAMSPDESQARIQRAAKEITDD